MKDELEADPMPPEVDFSGGVRGKFAGRFSRDVMYVPLAEDVSEVFQSADEVNTALRMVMKAAAAALPQKEREAS